MRCDQPQGVPQEAIDFLKSKMKVCECCEQTIPLRRIEIGKYEGMYMSVYPLFRYFFEGGYAEEQVQFTICDSGPMIFLKLVVYAIDKSPITFKIIQTFEWDQEFEENMLSDEPIEE